MYFSHLVFPFTPTSPQLSDLFDDEYIESDSEAADQEDGEDGSGNGWELLPEDDVPSTRTVAPEPVHVQDARTVYLVARGGAAGEFHFFCFVCMFACALWSVLLLCCVTRWSSVTCTMFCDVVADN